MYDDIPSERVIVEAFVHSLYPQGKAIAAMIGPAGNIKAHAALIRVLAIGEGVGIFLTGIDAVGNESVIDQPFIANIDHIQPLLAGRLAEITDRQNAALVQGATALQLGIADPGIFKSLFAEAGVLQTHFFIDVAGRTKGLAPFGFPGQGAGGEMVHGAGSEGMGSAGGRSLTVYGPGSDGIDSGKEGEQ